MLFNTVTLKNKREKMKKIMIIGALLLIGNMGFSKTQDSESFSRCQSFVSDIFKQYDLSSLVTISSFIDQKKPEFLKTTDPMYIPQKKVVVDPWEIPSVVKKVKLVFQGKILKNESYEFTIQEHTQIIPDTVIKYLKDNNYKDFQEF